MAANGIATQQVGSGTGDDDEGKEIVVIAQRLPNGAISTGGGGAIIVNIGKINSSDNGLFASLSEALRSLTTDRTDFDLDPRFTEKQREIIREAIRGMAEHPDFAAKMADMLAEGADINIVADFTGERTGTAKGITVGRNDDGTIDRGESLTIYINMQPQGSPVTDRAFANTIVHELLHALGDPSIDALLDSPNSTYDRGPTRDIFSRYDFEAPAGGGSREAEIMSVPAGGGIVTGSGDYTIFNGSEFADLISPGTGGGLIYSGAGDDRIVLAAGAAMTELVDGGGNDTIELPSGLSLADVSLRWTSDGHGLAVIVDGRSRLTVLNANGGGSVEKISVGGFDYVLGSLPVTTNHAPTANAFESKVETSFFGGYLGDGSATDLDGDAVTYRLETVSGEFADAPWRVDPNTGAVSGDFTRMAEPGSAYSFVTLSASDGIETTTSTLTIWWADRFELPTASATQRYYEVDPMQTVSFRMEAASLGGDPGMYFA